VDVAYSWLISDELEGMWKEAAVFYFKVIPVFA
jgi:hypothetical protein